MKEAILNRQEKIIKAIDNSQGAWNDKTNFEVNGFIRKIRKGNRIDNFWYRYIIWILRGNKDIVSRAKALSAETYGKIFITPIQVTEVYSGMTGNEKIKTKELIESFYMLDINKQIGELAGEYMQKFRKSHNIELADAIIGTTAKNLQF